MRFALLLLLGDSKDDVIKLQRGKRISTVLSEVAELLKPRSKFFKTKDGRKLGFLLLTTFSEL